MMIYPEIIYGLSFGIEFVDDSVDGVDTWTLIIDLGLVRLLIVGDDEV